jgi:hypothetical protein
MAGTVVYTFDVTAANIALELIGAGSTESAMGGTFELIVDQSDGHIGESDMVTLGDAYLANTAYMALGIGGIATANVRVNSAIISDFMQPVPAHIGPGGVAVIETDAYLEATVIVTGVFTTTFQTATNAGELLPVVLTITTSVGQSDTAIAVIGFTFGYEVGIPDISMTITLDLVMSVEGTAHVPDPSLGGLTALGLAGAGFWMRKRRT